jgi:cysteinyl-tRNA synthetase
MSSKYLGEYIDIHCGGVDHVAVHHENERAQSEGCFGHKWVNYWVHNEFLQLKDIKMSKSLGNILTVDSLKEKGYHPLAYRYLAMTAHYRSLLQFTFDALDAAQKSFDNLTARVVEIKKDLSGVVDEEAKKRLLEKFDKAIFNDVAMPQALAVMWEVVKDSALNSATKWAILSEMDSVLGFSMDEMKQKTFDVEPELQALLDERKKARQEKNWAKSDEIRDTLKAKGWAVKDLPDGTAQLIKV